MSGRDEARSSALAKLARAWWWLVEFKHKKQPPGTKKVTPLGASDYLQSSGATMPPKSLS